MARRGSDYEIAAGTAEMAAAAKQLNLARQLRQLRQPRQLEPGMLGRVGDLLA